MRFTLFAIFALSAICPAQNDLSRPSASHPQSDNQASAIVTFYSHGNFWTTGVPGTKHDIYVGGVFDGSQKLFRFTDGWWDNNNNRYISLRFAPGLHLFGASNGKRPEAREKLSLDLEAGKSYFIRAQGQSKGYIVQVQHGRLDLVPCSVAQRELAKARPLKDKALSIELRSQGYCSVNEFKPPSCSNS